MTLAAVGGNPELLLELGALLLTLGLLARLADRVRLSPIPLYLIVGLVLGQISDEPISFSGETIEVGADIGLALLLFMLGLEFTAEELTDSMRRSLRPGLLDIALNLTPGLVVGLLLGWDPVAALLLGGVTYISSSGVISKVLSDLGRLGNRETPAVLSLLVFEDLAMVAFLPLAAVLIAGADVLDGIGLVALAAAVATGALYLAIRHGETLSRALDTRSDEVFILTTLGLVLLAAGAAEELRLSAAVGAFLAGLAISGQVSEQARSLMAPLRDLFAAAFFIFFALQIDASSLPPVGLTIAALTVLTAATKLITGWFAAETIGARAQGRIRAGTVLMARGEFSIVIAGLGVTAGIEPDLGAVAAGYVLITALLAPLLTRWAAPIARRLESWRAEPAGALDTTPG
ncbi:MAG TPA: cation:proton antiporter [Solirubrobacterales bacterium]